MDRKLLDTKKLYKGSKPGEPANDSYICSKQSAEKEKKIEKGDNVLREKDEQIVEDNRENCVKILMTTIEHYFPELREWLKQITDPRNQELIEYKRETLIYIGIILLMGKRGARKKITDEMRTEEFCENLKTMSGQKDLKEVAHGDTVNYAYMRFKPEELEGLGVKMVRKLLRNRVLERYRLLNKFHMVAIDGTGEYSFEYRHCEECLERKDKEGKKKWYYHYKVQASLITQTGMCLPMCSEWVRNEEGYEKQDCELKAFSRLIKKVRELYSQLPICVLLDGLYAGEPQFKILEENRLEWIVVLKEGRMPEIFEWVKQWKVEFGSGNILIKQEKEQIELREKRTHEERLIRSKPVNAKREKIKERIYTWMSGIKHWNNERLYNVMTCKEKEDNNKNCDYVWLVSEGLLLSRETVEELSEKGGRGRWKIENEGFNIQKNGGYGLEHCYSRDRVAMKVWDIILVISHLINQLIEKGSLIVKEDFGSIRNISSRIFEHLRYFIFKKPEKQRRIQIRLCWNTS